MNNDRSYNCIIPTLTEDYRETKQYLYRLFECLSVSKLIFIGPDELGDAVLSDAENTEYEGRIDFVNENAILSFDEVRSAYEKRIIEIENTYGKQERKSRPGWYYQQFLKMQFSRMCEEEYYLCWDADTIPLKHIDMFDPTGKPFLDVKYEYIQSYFDTIKNLFGFDKVIRKSFVSEHMLFSRDMMREMIDDIMRLDLPGDSFYEKIFSTLVNTFQGFSEFETFGTWIAMRHMDAYRVRDWRSIRNTNFIINRKDITEDDLDWLATGFDAASFERYQETEPQLTGFFRNEDYRTKLTADIFYNELLEMGVFGEYKDGGLIRGNNVFAI